MTVDIIHKITKTYDHNNNLVKMIDECLNYFSIIESHFQYRIFYTIIDETISKNSQSIVNHKVRLNPYGWILLIFILANLSLLFI